MNLDLDFIIAGYVCHISSNFGFVILIIFVAILFYI